MDTVYSHEAVLLLEAVEALITDPDGFYVDGTFGRGGHSRGILERLGDKGRLLVVDKDPEALLVAEKLADSDPRVRVKHGSFAEINEYCVEFGVSKNVDGVLLDLGVSSPQLDDPARGFSFNNDGPLDMRMDTQSGETLEQWINSASEIELAQVMFELGEERFSRRMAKAIVKARSEEAIINTSRLAEIVKEANPAWERNKHPATRAFQAFRIHINNELDDLDRGLVGACDVLKPTGRLVVISFHSLEDRRVKRFIKKEEKGEEFPIGLPIVHSALGQRLKRVGKIVKASKEEVKENVRARSAVMRIAERLPEAAED